MSARLSPPARLAVRFIDTYRSEVSGRLDTSCPFQPSCSEYGRLAYHRHGFWKATVRTVGRLARCRPGYRGPRVDPP